MKNFIKKVIKAVQKPKSILLYLTGTEFIARLFPDKIFLQMRYRIITGRKLNLDNPQTFNEKLQWLKLYNRKPEYTNMVDKYEVRSYISEKIGEEYLIPLLGVWDTPDKIDFDLLPDKFAIKCNHNSGKGTVICKDKTKLDIEKTKKGLKKGLKQKYFYHGREWPYKNVKPRIVAEKFIEEENVRTSDSLVVYKVFCFNSIPKIIQVIQNDKRPNESIDYFDAEWNLLELKQNYPNSETHIEKNVLLEKMLELSHKLSEGTPFLRVDWYIPNDRLYFSEFTFYSDCGFAKFTPEDWDYKLGEMIKL